MRIALYAPSWPPGFVANGIVTYASHLVPALRRLGHEVFVLAPNLPAGYNDPYVIDLRHYSSGRGIWDRVVSKLAPESGLFKAASAAIARAIVDLAKRHKIEVFEIEESFGWSLPTTRLRLLPVVVRLHGPWALYGRFFESTNRSPINFRRSEREGEAIRHASFVTANCNDTVQAIKIHYGLDLKRSCIIPTPLDAVDDAATWDVKTCDKNSFLFVGRFDKLKGADLVLRAFFELAATNPELRLTFVGPDNGLEDSEGRVWFFEQYVERNFPSWFRSRIDFRGRMNHSDLMALRSKHFVTMIAAQIDTMGYMVLEPMSLGSPLVTTAVGGIPEFIKNRHNGLLVPSQDVSAMANACQTLLDTPDLAVRIGHQAWLDCRNLYNSDAVAAQTVAAYRKAIDSFEPR